MTGTGLAVPGRPPVRAGGFSGVWRPRLVTVTLVGVGLLVLVAAVNIGRGEFPISVGDVLGALVGGGDRAQRFIVLQLRLPRTLTGLLVGAALGMAGAITQAITRNPLASPDLLGVTGAAGTAAVAVIAFGGGSGVVVGVLAQVGLPIAALLGGLLAAVLVYGLAYRRGVVSDRLVLVGVGVNAVAVAITSWLLVVADINQATQATVWLTGSLDGRDWAHVVPVAVALALLVPTGLRLSFGLGALALGDDTASALGVRVNRYRVALGLVALTLAAVATASAGPIGFVALVVPQICQRLVGGSAPPLVTSAVYGALLTVSADLIARTALPAELPVGIVTAVLGAPYLLYLLGRRNRGVRL
ncbi:MAG TPA: iron chelate uptake ABC transporter family permease subunit [Pseudonocardia sp.]|uniref:FecCD family ABC transporter permease n=1 Tax=Pseudonocardia sp. TaxID=60912 RepID=UPI002CBB19A4|nr:iron chelate uptake ABC transporter family permease subunit [Pseudonocardia sp.]HTF48774.1 iron chelate uptake ABC transporter family permease subunit [Pseudonocardia sp.]